MNDVVDCLQIDCGMPADLPPHVGEVPVTREFETTITAIETKNDRSLES